MKSTAEDKQKHLEMIQNIINRMASNSFLFKGWSITIIAGVSAFATKEISLILMLIPAVSTVLFWSVDAYYLAQERLFRELYDDVAKQSINNISYSMKTNKMTIGQWFMAARRPVLLIFYGIVLMMLVVLIFMMGLVNLNVRFIYGA